MGPRILGASVVSVCLLSGTGSAQVVYGRAPVPPVREFPDPQPRGDSTPGQATPMPDRWAGGHDRRTFDRFRDRRPAMPFSVFGNDLFRAGPHTFAPRHRPSRFSRSPHLFLGGYGYLSNFYVPWPPLPMAGYSDEARSRTESNGYFWLQVQPTTAQVYIDGYYLGTVADFNSYVPGRPLEAGPHRVELRAPGFETVTFAVRILPDETTTYRADLRKIDDRPEPATPIAAPAAPRTLYVIPRCYAGDTPPRPEQLPAGCDATDVRTVRPR